MARMPGTRWASSLGTLAMVSSLVAALLLSGPGRLAAQLPSSEMTPQQRERLYDELSRSVAELERFSNVLRMVVKLVGPTVVHIETEKDETVANRISARRTVEEAGSGVLIQADSASYILTNWHVIKNAELQRIRVRLSDGRELKPSKVWSDPPTDVAVMAVSAPGLVGARIGDSAACEMGDFVIAVGSPFGLSHSVTYGIISAKGRRDLELGKDTVDSVRFQDFLQTDAAINPGNSGGPLINLRGEVIGINTAIASNSGGNEGIGFAIPINMAITVARHLIDHGSVNRAFLGVHLDRAFGPAAAARLGLPRPMGALINGITPKSPAALASLQVGDVILMFDGIAIEDDAHLINIVSLTEIGRDIPVIVHRGGKQISLSVRVGDRQEFEPRAETPQRTPNQNGRTPSPNSRVR